MTTTKKKDLTNGLSGSKVSDMLPITIRLLTFTLPVEYEITDAGPRPVVFYHVGQEAAIHGLPGRWKIVMCWLRADGSAWWVQAAPVE